jgi:hypothetical protein
MITPTQRKFLEQALTRSDGEFCVPVRRRAGGTTRMMRMLMAAGMIRFNKQKLAWFITTAGRKAVGNEPRAGGDGREIRV